MKNPNLFYLAVAVFTLILLLHKYVFSAVLPVPSLMTIAETSLGPAVVSELAVDRIMKMVDLPPSGAPPVPLVMAPSQTLALAGLTAGAGAIAGIGFYARTGRDPVYAAADAIASAADAIFVPGYQAFRANFVSPESFPASVSQAVGIEASVGSTLGNIVDYVRNAVDGSYTNLKSLISSNSSQDNYTVPQVITGGNIIATPLGPYKINTPYGSSFIGYFSPAYIGVYAHSNAFADVSDGGWLVMQNASVHRVIPNPPGGIGWSEVRRIYTTPFTGDPNTFPESGSVIYPDLKPVLLSPSPEVAAELKEAVSAVGEEKQIVTGTQTPASPSDKGQEVINQNQVDNFYNSNYSNVANSTVNNITSSSTSTQIAQYQAATEAAKAKAEEQKDTTMVGDADIPQDNVYDSVYENPDELDFVDTVHRFLDSGLPVLSAIQGSGLTASGSPVMSTTIWGFPISVDFTDWAGVLRTAGVLLVGLSSILAFRIVVGS